MSSNVLLLLLLHVIATFALVTKVSESSSLTNVFQKFKQAYQRAYLTVAEEAHRFECFKQTLKRIEDLNKKDSARHGINKFSDLCPDEFKKMYHNAHFKRPKHLGLTYTPPASEWVGAAAGLTSLDWRTKGAVNPVKDQKMCGSCWAFSAVCAMEGAWFLAGNHLASFSEEELVQCASTAGQGCQGGDMNLAIQWVIQNKGINSEKAYPYTSGLGITGECKTNKSNVSVATFSKVLSAPINESLIPDFLAKYGPLYIAVDASDGWQSYYGGVKSVCQGKDLDHGVALVGFTEEYWIVRNSWGKTWGESGYIYLKRGIDCDGMTSEVGTAEVKQIHVVT